MVGTEHALSASSTATPPPPPHFVLVPLVAQGHVIPLVDLARLLAERARAWSPRRSTSRGSAASPSRPRALACSSSSSSCPSRRLTLVCPPTARTPTCSPTTAQFLPFFLELRELAGPFDAYVRSLTPRPSCIISDWCNPWTAGVARSLGIPRLFFYGPSCFFSLCDLQASNHGLHELIAAGGDQDKHAAPEMPVPVVVTKATAPGFFTHPATRLLRDEAMEAMRTADGAVVNTFLDLEAQFVSRYEAALGKPVWTLGPLGLCNRDAEATASRGKVAAGAAGQQQAITAWLDKQAPGSVVYVSFGSVARKLPKQLFEVGHGLEDSGRPYLWVVKESEASTAEVQRWLQDLEARTAGRGLVVRGWAPQLAVLSHRAVGGFVTHCGWNSLLEAIVHGVPVVTRPHFGDQSFNEQLAVDVFGVGVPVGVTAPVFILDDESVAVVRAVSALMGGGETADERRKAKEYGEKAHRAMEKGGSSYENLTRLVQSFMRSEIKEHQDR